MKAKILVEAIALLLFSIGLLWVFAEIGLFKSDYWAYLPHLPYALAILILGLIFAFVGLLMGNFKISVEAN